MTITTAKRRRASAAVPSLLPLAALLALAFSPACRADWKVVPSIDARATYSDNAALQPTENAHGQFIFDTGPSIAISNDGPRLHLRAAASAHLYHYFGDSDGLNNSTRQLSADARAKLIDNLLYFDGAASIGQHSVSAFGPQANGYSNVNSAEVSTWRVSPYLMHRFGATATAELRYTRDSVRPGGFGLGKSVADTGALTISSGPIFQYVGWGLQASKQRLEDTAGGVSISEAALANIRYRINRTLDLTATAGYDKYNYQTLGSVTQGKNYSLGFNWAPSSRTTVQASAGKRYFGNSYFLSAVHRSRRTVWNVTYNDAITTTRAQFLIPQSIYTASVLDQLFLTSIPDPIARQQAVEAYIRATNLPATIANNINYFSNRFVLQKQLQLSAALNGARSTHILSLNSTRRNALSTAQADSDLLGSNLVSLNDNTRQLAATLSSNYRLNSRTAINLGLSAARNQSLTTGISDHQKLASLAVTRQFERRLRGAVELRRSQGNSDSTGARGYRENAISASLSLQL